MIINTYISRTGFFRNCFFCLNRFVKPRDYRNSSTHLLTEGSDLFLDCMFYLWKQLYTCNEHGKFKSKLLHVKLTPPKI